MNEYCAAIDLGTNTARLLIAEKSSTGITPVHIERMVIRLGGGFTDQYGLSVDAMERALLCLRKFSQIIADYRVTKVYASATSAVRDAVNGADFVDKILHQTGIRLNVINGDEEARLTLKGVLSGLDLVPDNCVILDVGGGSSEFTVALYGSPIFIQSMPIGVVRLTEGFLTHFDVNERIRIVLNQLEIALSKSGIIITEDTELIGTAGTATTLAAIKLEMDDYDYRKVNNFILCKEDIEAIFKQLFTLESKERLSVKGVEKGREDLIIAGMQIIIAVMEKFGFNRLKVSDFGLLEGLALSFAESDELF